MRYPIPQMIAIVAASCLPASVFAQAKDDLWEVTMKMEMPGMPMAMPAQVHRVCVSKSHKDEDLIPKRDNCKVLESSKSGNKLAYKMACTGAEPMTVSGEMTYAATSYEGRMRMVTQSGGQSMEMGQTFVGKRVGDCTATK
jgi:uncharacterized protein DUF3617